ncbi:MAG TPA: hypothetical protein VL978_02635 [Puia sp.]|nr:hypothetical protein [Puia sp.]
MQAHWTTIRTLLTAAGIVSIAAGLPLTGCSSRRDRKDVELLTNTPWKYEKAGFNSNDDGIFDALDPRIAGSEKDNTIVFCKDGTGSQNSLPFIWSLQKGDSIIYFQDQYYRIRTLNKHRLEIYADEKWGGQNTRYVIVLKH